MTPLLGQVFNALDTQQKGRVGQQAVLQAMQGLGFNLALEQLQEHMQVKTAWHMCGGHTCTPF